MPRPRLTARLNQGLAAGRKLTLISAPAGFGKTTLASAWAEEIGRATAWLSLDEGDNDLARFLTYLIAALQTTAPPLAKHYWLGCKPISRHPPKRSSRLCSMSSPRCRTRSSIIAKHPVGTNPQLPLL